MALDKINLRKLLQIMYADARLQRSLLLKDISESRRAFSSSREGGGDFYGPFWADAKDHAAGRLDIVAQTDIRIAANKSRGRLYPILRDSFLEMWNETMRWRNEPFQFVPESIKAQLEIKELNAVVKIENTASVKIWDGSHRIIYPYFSELPALPIEGVRLGFWALSEAISSYPMSDFRIVDFMRRAYFRPSEIEMNGDERDRFLERYDLLLRLSRKLQEER